MAWARFSSSVVDFDQVFESAPLPSEFRESSGTFGLAALLGRDFPILRFY